MVNKNGSDDMVAKIISAFPCCGKSYFAKTHIDIHSLDLDSSFYSCIDNHGSKVRNPNFPDNYINDIKEYMENYDFIFVSSHISVRTALRNRNIPYILVYPDNTPDCFQEWKQRCYQSNKINLWDMFLGNCWSSLLHSCKGDNGAKKHYLLQPTEYIDKVVQIEQNL